MKNVYYVPIFFLLLACGEKTNTAKETKDQIQEVIEVVEQAADSVAATKDFDFNKTVKKLPVKTLPHFDKTNFDSFVEAEDYKEIDTQVVPLDQIYPDYHQDGFRRKVIALYRLPLSDSYTSIIATILKTEHEMETLLITFDEAGKRIAHEVVSSDEIAESMSQAVGRVSEGNLIVHRILWGNFKQIEEVTFEITYNGKIEKTNTINLNERFKDFSLINDVLLNSKLDWIHTQTNLIRTKVFPENPTETIIVIPEIVDEGIMYFNLNSHIVIADNNTYKIKNSFFESHKSNNWESDAVRLDAIEIESTPYTISEDKKAFGVAVSHIGSSRVNPYSVTNLSLFVKSGDSLLKVLSDYTMKDYGGEWDGDCDGEFTETKKSLGMGREKTNGYFDIWVDTENSYTHSYKDKNEDCLSDMKLDSQTTILKFNGWRYSEFDADTILYSEFQPEKLDNPQIDKMRIESAHKLEDIIIAAGYYEPVNGQLVAPDTETDYGYRLLMLQKNNEIRYKSHGIGDLYLFEPHFYKSEASDKTFIICQLGFEYPFGGEVFIYQNENIKHIGTLDIEGDDPEYNGTAYLTDIIEIKETDNVVEFSFKMDRLVFNPGGEQEGVIANNNVRYVYKNNELNLLMN